jgi:outer membrane protein OmpA-like peptidoglycan-associated protein
MLSVILIKRRCCLAGMLVFAFFLSGLELFAQGLLLNGGFEDENVCTEYNIECAPEAWITSGSGLSQYFKDANRAYKGEHCMAVVAGHYSKPFDRTFIRSPLLCVLKKNQVYRLEMQIKSAHPILDSIGVYFGPIDPLLERKPIHLLSPSLYLASANHFNRDSGWQHVTIDYKAKGGEAYITFANFSKQDIIGNTGIRRQFQFIVLFDEVSLTVLNPNEKLCENWEQVRDDIYGQNERHQYLQRVITFRNDRRNPNKVWPGETSIQKLETFVLPDVLFAMSKKDLRPESKTILDSFCRGLAGKKIDSLIIEGHTDNTGSETFNQKLSNERAESAAQYLQACSPLFRVPVAIRGWGSQDPIAPNDTPQDRQRNRRVQLKVYLRE